MSIARFITIEGIEGVGKSTQISCLSAELTVRGIAHEVTREPGGTPLAEKIRRLVLERGEESLPAMGELLLMFAGRAVHLANRIEPALCAGRWVICDRFTDATYAYQGGGRGVDASDIAVLERLVQGMRRPDLTLLLDASVAEGLERARSRNAAAPTDRFESERAEFFERVRALYLARARAEPGRIVVIDAGASIETVSASLMRAIEARGWLA